MKRKPKVYIQMFLSYLGMLVIPVAAATVIYGYSRQVIRGQTEKMNDNLLEMIQRDLDQQISDVQKIAARLAMDTSVQAISKVKSEFGTEDQMALYYLYNDLQSLAMSEDFINDVFIYFNNTQTVCSLQGNMSAELFYDLYYRNEKHSLEEFREYMRQRHYNDTLRIRRENGDDTLLFTMTTLDSNVGEGSATIGIGIKFSQLESRLSSMKWDDSMDAAIISSHNGAIYPGEAKDSIEGLVFEELEEGNHTALSQRGGRCMISVLQSKVIDWKYVAVLPMTLIESSAKQIQLITIFCLFGCGIVGFGVSYYLTGKNYNPLKSLVDTFKKHGDKDIGEEDNVYQWLNTQMDDFFKKHVDANRLIKANAKSLKNYYLFQLLQDYYYGKGQELERCGIRLNLDYNVVILFEPEKKKDMQELVLQRFIIMNIFGEMCQDHFNVEMAEMGERVAAIINIPDSSSEYGEILKEKIENLQAMAEESFKFSCTALMGSVCRGLEGIHTSYLQAAELEQYVVILDTDLIIYDDVKNLQLHYDYSIEAEEKIINAIEAGDSRQAGKLMMQIFDHNLSGKVSADTYRCLVYDMVGTLVRGAGRGGYTTAARELDFPDGFSMKRLPVDKLKERFRELLDQICKRVQEIKKETAGDKSFSRKVEAYIEENFKDPDLNISITSQHFDITPAYLSSIYKKQTGRSLLDYINTMRISHAQKLLEQGYSVVEVAPMAGFRDSGSFIRAFKKKTGVTPGQFKSKF
ncbi:MAG: AraC family transcriptional regulator [Hungatella sp.]|nr:AraC family transcriptional regulator [Hungatella sp.]